ncbi:hypothetical protein NPX13_g5582 [Xylaria arbuscula]|uniref:Uncharacterized protein n=1 Tax=Xylaria arbuscula TaxID=114810 RepID=A0A9W8TKV5_9PEZI|nr:hypothetical protein NPX13_g5582 [Xylaria arbuscula]
MTLESKLSLEPIRFLLPRSLRLQRFHRFQKLPYDIRYLIWNHVIFTPGIHFLELFDTMDTPDVDMYAAAVATGADGGLITTLSETHIEDDLDSDWFLQTATLKPAYPIARADNSYYLIRNKTLAQLRDSYFEAAILVERELARPGNLILENAQLVTLQQSLDIVCIDYPYIESSDIKYPDTEDSDIEDFDMESPFNDWVEHLNLKQLAKIRRLAVRYHHGWQIQDVVCRFCGEAHRQQQSYSAPRHVYEFAALFKNLEEFYFIDYMAVRTSTRKYRIPFTSCSVFRQALNMCLESDTPRRRFACGQEGRTYFEVDPKSDQIHTRVFTMLPKLRVEYGKYCRREKKGPARPEKVRFGVLGCEWNADEKLTPSGYLESQTNSSGRKRPMQRSRKRPRKPVSIVGPVSQPVYTSILPVIFGDAGRSHFNFSLEISLPR